MNKLQNRSFSGELITTLQACELSNLGRSTVRKIAEEAGAVRKIGKCYRINQKKFFDYIEANYAE